MIKNSIMELLHGFCSVECFCDREHHFLIDDIIIEKGTVNRIAEVVARYNAKKVFLIADQNTHEAAGKQICEKLFAAGIAVSKHDFRPSRRTENSWGDWFEWGYSSLDLQGNEGYSG